MSDYNDGSRFGGDAINPYDDIPVSFEQAEYDDRPVLLSRNEIPRRAARPPQQLDRITEKSLTRRIEGFSGGTKIASTIGWSQEDMQLFIIFLIIIVIVLQIKIMTQPYHSSLPSHSYHSLPHLPVQHYISHPLPVASADLVHPGPQPLSNGQ